jgi:predicted amidohydrolase
MCTTGFTMEPATFAEPLSGPSVTALAAMTRDAGVHVLAGVATAAGNASEPAFYNSALLFDRSGAVIAEYRKQRLFGYAGETDSYASGTAPLMTTIGRVRIAPLICFDLRFPELFRAIGPRVDAIVLIASWPASRQSHWDVLTRARAIENQCYIVAVNRTGEGGGIEYAGGSIAYDPWGERVAGRIVPGAAHEIIEIDPARVTAVRSRSPFTEDLRQAAHRPAES